MMDRVRHLLEMIRFSHTIFAMPFSMLAAVMAWTTPTSDGSRPPFNVLHLLGIVICMVGARSAAMAFNRIVDRRIDALNPRTQNRHLPAGVLSLSSVVTFTIVSSLVFVSGTLLFLPNWLPIALSLPVLAFLCLYSFTKRFTVAAHWWLGASLMLAPISTWIALRGLVLLAEPADIIPSAVLGLSVLFWVSGFDIIYACQDVDFDASARLRSIPAWLGVQRALRLAAGCHMLMVIVLSLLPWIAPQLHLSWPYGIGIGIVGALLAYEHWLVRPDDLTRVNVAFFNMNAIVSIGLFLIVSLDLLT